MVVHTWRDRRPARPLPPCFRSKAELSFAGSRRPGSGLERAAGASLLLATALDVGKVLLAMPPLVIRVAGARFPRDVRAHLQVFRNLT
jgi:hypothetical protein